MKALKIIGIFFCSMLVFAGFSSIVNPTNPGAITGTIIATAVLFLLDLLLIYMLIRPSLQKEKPPKPQKQQPEKPKRETREEREGRRHQEFMDRVNDVMSRTELPVVRDVQGMFLKSGEVCHFQSDAAVLVIKNEIVGHTAGHRGVSVRIAKGLTLHSGGSRGHAIRQDVTHTYRGLFTMTNMRFAMTGEKAFEYPLDKLTYFDDYQGGQGLILQFGKSTYTILMEEPYWIPKIIDLLQESPDSSKSPQENPDLIDIRSKSIDLEENIPTPLSAEISYLDAKALKYWDKKKTDFVIPQYYSQTAFGRNVGPALERLLDGGYLEIGGIEKSIALKTIPEIKAILADKELKTSGNKPELIQRLINNIDPDELTALFPVSVYCITEKGRKALDPYAALEKNDEHALGLSYYRIMQEREKDSNASDEDILARLLSQDIQDCYRNNDRAGFQRAIAKGARFMEENGEYRKALDAYILSFFMWSIEAQSYNFGNSDQQSYYLAKNLERCASMCGMPISELISQIRNVVTENHPFALATDGNIQKCIARFKSALSIQ